MANTVSTYNKAKELSNRPGLCLYCIEDGEGSGNDLFLLTQVAIPMGNPPEALIQSYSIDEVYGFLQGYVYAIQTSID